MQFSNFQFPVCITYREKLLKVETPIFNFCYRMSVYSILKNFTWVHVKKYTFIFEKDLLLKGVKNIYYSVLLNCLFLSNLSKKSMIFQNTIYCLQLCQKICLAMIWVKNNKFIKTWLAVGNMWNFLKIENSWLELLSNKK